MLHTVNKSPFERNALETCLRYGKAGSVILLIEDGVYGAINGTRFAPQLEKILGTISVYALQPDVEARGIQDRIMDGVKLVDYNGFVDLVVEHSPVMAWL